MAQDRLNAWQALFYRALAILGSTTLDPAALAGWSFGGGTVLMRRYRHRISKDIDIFLPDPQLLGYLSPRLNPAAEALCGDYVEHANFLKLYFPEGEIDFVASGRLTDEPLLTEWIADRAVSVESSAEILAKKIWHRGAVFTARDVFDFAAVVEREPGVLSALREVLALRRKVLLARLDEANEALREDFAALDVLEYEASYDACARILRAALGPPSHAAQPRAAYRAQRNLAPTPIS